MDTDVTRDWKSYINERKEEEINSIIKAEKLNEDKARKFIENSLRDGFIRNGNRFR